MFPSEADLGPNRMEVAEVFDIEFNEMPVFRFQCSFMVVRRTELCIPNSLPWTIQKGNPEIIDVNNHVSVCGRRSGHHTISWEIGEVDVGFNI